MRKVHKNTVKARIRNHGIWNGYLAPNKVPSYHVKYGWGLGCYVEIDNLEQLEKLVAAHKYYYCGYELGYYVAYWEEN